MYAEGPEESRTWFLTVSVLRWSSSAICLRRAALLEQAKHLDLTGSQMRVGRGGPLSARPSSRPKTPTTRSPLMSGTALISTATRTPAVETKTPVASVDGEVPSTFWANSSRARRLSSGATTEVKWRPRMSPRSCSAAGLIQRTTSRPVEDVARDADVCQSPLHVAADGQAGGHHEVSPIRAREERTGLEVAQVAGIRAAEFVGSTRPRSTGREYSQRGTPWDFFVIEAIPTPLTTRCGRRCSRSAMTSGSRPTAASGPSR